MGELSEFLIEQILKESVEQVTALFGGGFKPPTKGHLEVVLKGLQQNPEINKVKILVGSGERNGFTQNQAIKIWDLYDSMNLIPVETEIIPVTSPFTYYKEYLKENPEDKVYVFMGSRSEDEKDQMDVKQRSEFVKKYSDNVIPVEISTAGRVSGTEARKLFKTDVDSFRNMFPENLTDNDFKKLLNILGQEEIDEGLKDTIKKISSKTKEFIINLKDVAKREGKETARLLGLIYKILVKSYTPTDDEKSFMKGQSLDLGRITILTAIQLLPFPGTSALTAGLIKLGKKYNFEVLPTPTMENLNENATYSDHIDYKSKIKELTKHMVEKGMNIVPLPKVIFKHADSSNAKNFFGKTAYYEPDTQTIVLYTEGRHPKDIVRSFAHEMVHHKQNLENRLDGINTTNTQEDDHLTAIEAEAYQDGNLTFRGWTDTVLNEDKDPFELKKLITEIFSTEPQESLEGQEKVRIFNQNCDCDKT